MSSPRASVTYQFRSIERNIRDLGYKHPIRASTWNTRDAHNCLDGSGARRLVRTVKDYSLDILSLQEAGFNGPRGEKEGRVDLHNGCSAIWTGRGPLATGGRRRFSGTGLILSKRTTQALIGWTAVSDRILFASFRCVNHLTLSLLAYHAPHTGLPASEREKFRVDLRTARQQINRHHIHLELGDANAKVGSSGGTDGEDSFGGALGRHGVDGRNAAGVNFLDDCAAEGLCVANTFFQHKRIHKASCRIPSRTQIPGRDIRWDHHANDVIVVNRSFFSSVRDVRAFRGPNRTGLNEFRFSDHQLVVATLSLRLRGIPRSAANRPDLTALRTSAPLQQKYQEAVAAELAKTAAFRESQLPTDGGVASTWEAIATAVITAAGSTLPDLPNASLGHPTPSPRLLELAAQRRQLLDSFAPNQRRTRAQTQRLNALQNAVRKESRRNHREHLEDLGEEMEAAARRADHVAAWHILEEISPGSLRSTARRAPASDSTIKAADGTVILGTGPQAARLRSYYSELLNAGTGAEADALDTLPLNLSTHAAPVVSEDEFNLTLSRLKNGKAPGPNGVRNEHLRYAGAALNSALFPVFLKGWEGGLPQACKISDLISVPKKGDAALPQNRRGIQVADKLYLLMSKTLADRLSADNEERISESQAGFRRWRGCRDQRCSLQLLIDESLERAKPLHVALVDLEKAFDRVDRAALLAIMRHYGVEEDYIRVVHDLHTDTKARVRWRNTRSEAFDITWGVQQGSPASNPEWNLFVSIIVDQTLAELGPAAGVLIRWNVDGQLIPAGAAHADAVSLRQLLLLLADDITVTAETAAGLQHALEVLFDVCRRWGMRISISKTKVLSFSRPRAINATPAAIPAPTPTFTIDGVDLEVVESAKYLGSWYSADGSLDREISARISAASFASERLRRTLWKCRRVSLGRKISLYRCLVLTILLYGAESWALTRAQTQRLETFHMRCLRRILNVKWWQHISNEEVLRRVALPSIAALLRSLRLTWLGHIARMADSRLPKRLLFAQRDGTRPLGPPRPTLRRLLDADVKKLRENRGYRYTWLQESQERQLWSLMGKHLLDTGKGAGAGVTVPNLEVENE